MNSMPSYNTTIEIKVEKILKELNINYVKQYDLYSYFIDFAIPEKKIFIECDGTYWHSLDETKKRDIKKDKIANKIGWKMIRFAESLINTDPESCRKVIQLAIARR